MPVHESSLLLYIDPATGERGQYAASRLRATLESIGMAVEVTADDRPSPARVILTITGTPAARACGVQPESRRDEGFTIRTIDGRTIAVVGDDPPGLLYGCLELADRVRDAHALPTKLDIRDAPAMALRGPCIGMQKTFILPGRKGYEYPYTPELFPFFYDEAFWQEYLDFLVDNRMNSLYLWSGNPFGSLVQVPEYPYAVEVSPEVFEQNVRMFRFIAAECQRRGIWLVQKFYSIILPKPFAEHHGIDTQLSAPTPEASDYMRKAIAGFVVQYPNVGLLVCLGEALAGIDNQIYWLRDVVLRGVLDGLQQAGIADQPPVVVRAHATDPTKVIPPALEVYRNLYTMAKYNGESLTTSEPRGVRQQVHLAMSRLGSRHIANVHILANLEPFRYGAQRFICQCVQAAQARLGASGIHLYPLAYWSWPESPDNPPLCQIDRDWMWFSAWARYAWNPQIDQQADRAWWITRLSQRFGQSAAPLILDALNDAGECAPRLLRRFGITEGNRQTMSLGMTLDQLVNPEKYRPFPELWESQSPPGERLSEYVEREWNGQPHEGETPPQIIKEVLSFAARAVAAIDAAEPLVTSDREEFARIRNDIHCIAAMSRFYAEKARAAMRVLRHRFSRDLEDLRAARTHLHSSLEQYRILADLTRDTYRFANTMQTAQRRIPVPGGIDGKPVNYHWTQVLPVYEQELADFEKRVHAIESGLPDVEDESHIRPLPAVAVRILSPGAEVYEVKPGAQVYTDRPYRIQSLAAELVGGTGIRFSHSQAKAGDYEPIEFEVDQPVQVLVGYFQSQRDIWLQPPNLETDANAVERGGAEPVIDNAATIDSLPALNVHALRFGAGLQRLEVRGPGSFVVLGVVPADFTIQRRDAGRGGAE